MTTTESEGFSGEAAAAETPSPETVDVAGQFDGKPVTNHLRELLSAVRASGVVGGGGVEQIVIALGDVVGRDKIKQPEARATHAVPRILSRKARELYEVHAWPESANVVRECLAGGQVLVLTGPLGSGKAALAINLLAETCTDIYELSRIPQPADLTEGFFREGCGYVLADLPQRTLVEFADVELPRVVDMVTARGAKLVLTVEPSFTHVPAALEEFVVPLTGPAPAVDVLRVHLRHHIGSEGADQIAARPEVCDLLERSMTAGEVAMLAFDLAGRTDLLADKDVGWRLGQQRRAEVDRWLAEVSDAHWPFLISLAVLDGLPHDMVLAAARQFSSLTDADPLVDIPPLTAGERARLLDTARAEVIPRAGRTRWGEVPVDEVRFRRRGIAQWVLDYLWRHAYPLRESTITWLSMAGGLVDDLAKQKFAAAVGQLMTHDFKTLEPRIFRPWATEQFGLRRESALVALAVVSEHPDLRLVMVKMVLSWMKGEYAEKWMAARSLGDPLGHFVPEATLTLLGELAKDDTLLPYAIGQALREFTDGATDDRFELTLDTLLRWAEGADDNQRHAALYSFLQICAWISDEGNEYLPRVLTRPVRTGQDPVVLLWRQAIVDAQVHISARQTMFGWARRCEVAADGPLRLAEFLVHVTTPGRITFLVRRAAQSWRADRFPAPHSADAVLAAIEDRERRHDQ